jgi:serine/threonine protein kinase
MFIESLAGNIKEKYFFEKKLGSGGYGAVYLAKNKISGKYSKPNLLTVMKVRKLQLKRCRNQELLTTRLFRMK